MNVFFCIRTYKLNLSRKSLDIRQVSCNCKEILAYINEEYPLVYVAKILDFKNLVDIH